MSALAVPVFGFILWNLVFILFAFLKIPVLFVAVITLFSWLIFKSKIPDLVKAIWLTVPVAVILVFIGIYTYTRPVLTYGLGALIVAAILVYLRRTNRPWIYYYAALFTAITLFIFTLTGGEI